MTLQIQGVAEFDPFGIRFLKHNTNVNQTINVGDLGVGQTFSLFNNEVAVYIGLSDDNGSEVFEVKLSVLGFPIYDYTLPLTGHVGQTPLPVNVGGPQLGFTGNVTITA